jgi:hypothetical protein
VVIDQQQRPMPLQGRIEAAPGELLALVGPSGAGKTSMRARGRPDEAAAGARGGGRRGLVRHRRKGCGGRRSSATWAWCSSTTR